MTSSRAPGLLFIYFFTSSHYLWKPLNMIKWAAQYGCSSSRSYACFTSSAPRCLIKELSSLFHRSGSFDRAFPPTRLSSAPKPNPSGRKGIKYGQCGSNEGVMSEKIIWKMKREIILGWTLCDKFTLIIKTSP